MLANNLAELFTKQASKNKNKVAFEYRLRRNEPYRSISWKHLSTLVYEVAYGLIELGLKKGDNIAILSDTRYEWAVCDLAILSCGGIVVPIYPTLGDEAVNYILNNSESQIVILEDKGQLQKIRSQWDKLPNIKYAIVIEDLGDLPKYDKRILSLHDLKDKGKLNFSKDPNLIKNHIENISQNDLATIIYTSGTTGEPKGVMLTHKNILSVLDILPKVLPVKPTDKFLSFLPLSHVFERVGGLHYAISCGSKICFCSSIDQIGKALQDSKSTIMLVVPRILEKIYSKLTTQIQMLPEFEKKFFNWAINIGKKKLEKSNIWNFIQFTIANRLVFSKIRKRIAPKLRYFISGSAPLSKEIAEFFFILRIPVLEGYGLTETSAPVCVNSPKEIKIGTVGKPLPNVSIKIAEDGEILIKGPNIFTGYFKNIQATNEAFSDGWFCSGDIGVLDADGFLKITDRKKDIIKNSGGKIIAPQKIENSIKTSPYISNIIVIGDKKKYLSSLVTLEPAAIFNYAKQHNVPNESNLSSLVKDPKIITLISEEIKLKTAGFADYEQVRKFTILPNDFTIESGEITPTLKVKRKLVEEKYKNLIELMYPLD